MRSALHRLLIVSVIVLIALGGFAPAANAQGPMTLTAEVGQNAAIQFDYATYPVVAGVAEGQWSMGPQARLNPWKPWKVTGIPDPRPKTGVDLETRAAIEFDLGPARDAGLTSVATATLHLSVYAMAGGSSRGATLAMYAYDGDGTVSVPDYGSVRGAPEPNLGFVEGGVPVAYTPTPMQYLGQLRVTGVGPLTVDLTSYINKCLARGVRWAGIAIRLDLATLPAVSRVLIPTTYGVQLHSSYSGSGPTLVLLPEGLGGLQDTVAPTLTFLAPGVDALGRLTGTLRAADAESGLASITALQAYNTDVTLPGLTPGTPEALLTATRTTNGWAAHARVRAADRLNNTVQADVVFLVSTILGSTSHTLNTVSGTERVLTVYNGSPGLTSLQVTVNSRYRYTLTLTPGKVQAISIAAGLQTGETNWVTLTGRGSRNTNAVIVLSDGRS